MLITPSAVPHEVDCLVLGGGITGAGVARDAAMRGLRVLLVDAADFASGTSHLTSKLIHGGLRYLEHGHFRLVFEGIVERDRLLNRIAPNLVRPLQFVIPFERRRLPKWLLTVTGLKLYGLVDRVRCGRRSNALLKGTLFAAYPTLRLHPFGVSFWDAQTNDARLVMATLRTAEAHGAVLCNYTEVQSAHADGQGWTIKLHSPVRSESGTVRARMVVNATGPWSPMTAQCLGVEPMDLMWIKGSHLILRRPPRFGDDAIVIRSLADARPLWVVPWENRLIVGSTESEHHGDLRDVHPSEAEVHDLLGSVQGFFPEAGFTRADITCAYAGVRPIIRQEAESQNRLSREHRLHVDRQRNLITITGGKLTTFRRMAEQTVDEVETLLGRPAASFNMRRRLRNEMLWPGLTRLEGARLIGELAGRGNGNPIDVEQVRHLVRHYGHDAGQILADIRADESLVRPLLPDLPYCLAELAYLCRTEHVCHLVDLIKRRTPIFFLAERFGREALPLVVEHISGWLGWDHDRQRMEMQALAAAFDADMAAVGLTTPAEPTATSTPVFA